MKKKKKWKIETNLTQSYSIKLLQILSVLSKYDWIRWSAGHEKKFFFFFACTALLFVESVAHMKNVHIENKMWRSCCDCLFLLILLLLLVVVVDSYWCLTTPLSEQKKCGISNFQPIKFSQLYVFSQMKNTYHWMLLK